MTIPMKVAVIYGSARPGRFCDTVAGWVETRAEADGRFVLEKLDPRTEPGRAELSRAIGDADGFIVVTPEYNHSFPAPLKQMIDAVGSEWSAKPVAFVAYGGVSGGLRAVEHLRNVFAELHAVGIRDTVSFANASERFDATGRLLDADRAERSMATMLDRLAWWARTLREGRNARAYGEAA